MVIVERFQHKLQPYKLIENNKIEIKAIIAGTAMLYSGLIFEEGSKHNYPRFNAMAFSLVIIYNSYFIAEWIFLFVVSLKLKNKKIKSVLEMYRSCT